MHDVVLSAFWPAYFNGRKLRHKEAFWQLSSPELPLPFQASEADIALRNREILTEALKKTVQELEKSGKRVWILGPLPENPYDPLKRNSTRGLGLFSRTPIRAIGDQNWHREASVIAAIRASIASTKAQSVWWHEQFCPVQDCHGEVEGTPLYMDDNHLSRHGADYAEHTLRRIFNDATARN